MYRNSETLMSDFLAAPLGELKTSWPFAKAYSNEVIAYAYLLIRANRASSQATRLFLIEQQRQHQSNLLMSPWNLQENMWSEIFWTCNNSFGA